MENGQAFQFTRDDERRRIRVTLQRTLGAAELISIVDRQVQENAWTYGTLYDLRVIDRAIDRRSAIEVAEHVQKVAEQHGRRGPVAIVTRKVDVLAAGHVYALDNTRQGRAVDVFWDIDDAERWLSTLV
jgi:hypothetical protein